MRRASRASDELILRALRLRCEGHGAVVIGAMLRKSCQFVSTACNRVRRADQDESGEPLAEVNKGYWR